MSQKSMKNVCETTLTRLDVYATHSTYMQCMLHIFQGAKRFSIIKLTYTDPWSFPEGHPGAGRSPGLLLLGKSLGIELIRVWVVFRVPVDALDRYPHVLTFLQGQVRFRKMIIRRALSDEERKRRVLP